MWWQSIHLPSSLSSQCLDPNWIVRNCSTFLLQINNLIPFRDLQIRYILIAISEILASITGLEYAFTKAPKNMRSLVMACFLFMTALSSAIGEIFVCKFRLFFSPVPFILLGWLLIWSNCSIKSALSADPLLVWNYSVVAVLALITGFLFWWSVRDLDAREDELNDLAEGHLDVP